jgi:hypothetical protein
MFNNTAIDVSLGLVFIFLLYSLLASIFQEGLARWLGLRPRTLVKAIRRMLQDGDSKVRLKGVTIFIDIFNNIVDYFRPLKKGSFLKAFYDSPPIKYLGENNTNSKPSYIDPATFSKTIMQMLRGKGFNHSLGLMQTIRGNLSSGRIDNFTINSQTQEQLTKLWVDSGNDAEQFKAGLEEWFNNTMDRATGWYKRQTQLLLFLLGFGVAAAFNVDAIAITKILANNEGIRKDMVNIALSHQKKYDEQVQARKDSIFTDPVTKVKTVIKYVEISDSALLKQAADLKTDAAATQQILGLGRGESAFKKKYQPDETAKYAGWILTAFAISLGAPFWFGILNKIMMLRNGGTKPEDSKTASSSATPSIKPVG